MVADAGAAARGRDWLGVVAAGGGGGAVFAVADEGHRGFDFDRQGDHTGVVTGGEVSGVGGGVRVVAGTAFSARLAEYVEHDVARARGAADDA